MKEFDVIVDIIDGRVNKNSHIEFIYNWSGIDEKDLKEEKTVTFNYDPKKTIGTAVLYRDGKYLRAKIKKYDENINCDTLTPAIGFEVKEHTSNCKDNIKVFDKIKIQTIGLFYSRNIDERIKTIGEQISKKRKDD